MSTCGEIKKWNMTTTTFPTTGRISLYFKSTRGLSVPHLYQYLRMAAHESVVDTFVLVFHLRDCRGGKGERVLGRQALQWLFLSYPEQFMKVAKLIPEYGRWDDLLQLWPRVLNLESTLPDASSKQRREWRSHLSRNFCVAINSRTTLNKLQRLQKEIVGMVGTQLVEDRKNMKNSLKVSLCAKWSPTEKDSLDQCHNTVKELCRAMSLTQAKYRKVYTTPLREYLQVTETLMCRKDWDRINFDKVPSRAMKNLKKAFEKHCSYRLYEWRDKLSSRDAKVNAKQVLPHELICEIAGKGTTDPICQAQWLSLEEQASKSGVFTCILTVVDTSVSMKEWDNHNKDKYSFTPMDVAIGIGILSASSSNAFPKRCDLFKQPNFRQT